MAHGLLDAEVTDGPYKGWTLGAAMALQSGQTPQEVKQAMRDQVEKARKDLDDWLVYIDTLPDVVVLAD